MPMEMFEVPIFRITLTRVEHTLLQLIDTKAGEMRAAIENGIQLAMSVLPAIVAERCRVATVEAIEEATEDALKEYFSPGGAGYEQVMEQVKKTVSTAKI